MRHFPVIHDHDGHPDDLISLAMLAMAKDRVLAATTLSPADCFLEPATDAVEKLLTLFGAHHVKFARDMNEGTHPFPDQYREDSNHAPHLPIFKDLRKTVHCSTDQTAPELLVDLLSGSERFDIVETGPLTNIAAALEQTPSIAKNINSLWVMGGAIHVDGNVSTEPSHDGSAEWNFYNHPIAAQRVLASGIPITVVSLDITNHLPVTARFVERLKDQRSFQLSRFTYEAQQIVLKNPHQNYYMWDILTVIGLLQPNLFQFKKECISIVTDGKSAGRSIPDPAGIEVTVPILIEQKAVEDFLLDFLKR